MTEFQDAGRINLPPPLKLVTAREGGDAFAHARAIASAESAGMLVLGGEGSRVGFALLLEAEQALESARRVHYAGMSALADTLAAVSPSPRPLAIDWPDRLRDGSTTVAQTRLAWPREATEEAVPEWLIFGADVQIPRADADAGEPAANAWFRRRLVEAFSRQFMRALDRWYEQGFAALARDVDARLSRESGIARSIDRNGDLLLQAGTGEPRRLPLAEALTAQRS